MRSTAEIMEWALGVALVVGIYLWARHYEAQKRERRELRAFSYHWWFTDEGGQDWDVDLVDMGLSVQGFRMNPEPGDSDYPRLRYSVRRKDGGQWQYRITENSRQAELERLSAQPKSHSTWANENRERQLSGYSQTPRWSAIDGEVAGPLESQYQRFLRHYKES